MNTSYINIVSKKEEFLTHLNLFYAGTREKNNYLDNLNNGRAGLGENYGIISNFEYGINDDISLGFMLGGEKQNFDFFSDNLDGNSIYTGLFTRMQHKKLKIMLGAGYQYSRYMTDKVKNYGVNSFNTFLEARYAIVFSKYFRMEPKIRGTYYRIGQDSILGNKINSYQIESVNLNAFDITTGIDFIFENKILGGTISNIISLEGVNIKSDNDKNLLGRDGNVSISLLKTPEAKALGRLSYALEIEKDSGFIYNFKSSAELTDSGYANYLFSIGIGYKFNKIELPTIIKPPVVETKTEIKYLEIERYNLNLYFGFNKSNLINKDKVVLNNIINKIAKHEGNIIIKVIGHTDSVGSSKYNRKLSLERAISTRDYLKEHIKNGDIKFEVDGMGESNPIATNKTKVGRSMNRRVELIIKSIIK